MEFDLSRTIQLTSSSLAGLRPATELVADLVLLWVAIPTFSPVGNFRVLF